MKPHSEPNSPAQYSSVTINQQYRTVGQDSFPPAIEIAFIADNTRQVLHYQKVVWNIAGDRRSIRYGDNPSQPAALYRLVNGNVTIAGVTQVTASGLVSGAELLQSGKHPGKTNLADIDIALQLLRHLHAPTAVIVKHTNPCAVACAPTVAEALAKAQRADSIAAFGGSYIVNRPVDEDVATMLSQWYCEVVAAPSYLGKSLAILKQRANLRVFRIEAIERLQEYAPKRYLDWKSLMDGGVVVQWSYSSATRGHQSFKGARARTKDGEYYSQYHATDQQLDDLLFAWHVAEVLNSNAVVLAHNQCTRGIGCGSLDRVGAVRIAQERAYLSRCEHIARSRYGCSFAEVSKAYQDIISQEVRHTRYLAGSVMASDAFFPFTDGVHMALHEGISAIAQPGGAMRDHQIISLCNQWKVPLLFTEQRSFRH